MGLAVEKHFPHRFRFFPRDRNVATPYGSGLIQRKERQNPCQVSYFKHATFRTPKENCGSLEKHTNVLATQTALMWSVLAPKAFNPLQLFGRK
jgi:hypothetical protein